MSNPNQPLEPSQEIEEIDVTAFVERIENLEKENGNIKTIVEAIGKLTTLGETLAGRISDCEDSIDDLAGKIE